MRKTGRKVFSLRRSFRDQKRSASYLDYARQHKRSSHNDESNLRLHILPRFVRKRLCDLTRREVDLFIGELRQSLTAASANRFLCLLSAMYRRAIARKLAERTPCAGIQHFRENNQHQRFLSPADTGRLLAAMEGDPNTVAMATLKFVLLTKVRRQEALRSPWEHVDLERRVLFVPHTKAGRARYVQLNDAALAVLAGLGTRGESEWVFASARAPGKPINDPRKTFSRVLEAAGITDPLRIHDLRHTFASLAVNAGQ